MLFVTPKVTLTAIFVTITVVLGNMTAIAGNPLSDCLRLSRELKLSEAICEGKTLSTFKAEVEALNVDGVSPLHQIGVALRRLGYLEESEAALQQALIKRPEDEAISLSLGNLQQQMYRRAISLYKSTDNPATRSAQTREAIAKANAALTQYQSIAKNQGTNSQMLADLNWMDLWSSLEQDLPELKELQQQNLPKAIQITQFEQSEIDLNRKIEARIGFAESLLRAADLNSSFANLSQTNADKVLRNAEADGDMRSVSRAYGVKGLLLKRVGRNRDAITELDKAASAAQSVSANDLAYKWYAELAKISEIEGSRGKALEYYKASIASLQQIRSGILQLNPQVQYEFRDRAEPIYREYMGLLLDKPSPDLREVIRVNDKLRVGELENFLQCDLTRLTSLLDLPIETSAEATLYIIRLPKNYAQIIRSKDGRLSHKIIDEKELEVNILGVKRNLQSDRIEGLSAQTYRRVFGALYQSLILPIEQELPKAGTLVLIVDPQLQNIPWAMLYDTRQQKYFIEKYSISYSLGSEVAEPKRLSTSRQKVLLAGVSQQTNLLEFPEIPSVRSEFEKIQQIFKNTTLLNQNFTSESLLRVGQNYPIIHLASHGQFSSDPQNTFVLGWNEKITLSKLSGLIRNREEDSLELLILSACETAKGDGRAMLGIAGTLVQTGARAAFATLWKVNDASQTILMEEFYKGLNRGETKAEALRSAQISLILSDTYSNPYFWGSAVLVGSHL